MSFYHFMVQFFKYIFYIFNGKPEIHGLENVPTDRPVILAGTHRSYVDPFLMAIALYPEQISFMGKDSLFKNKLLNKLLLKAGMFPVNRDKPSPASIRTAIKKLTDEKVNLGIFPSGSRHKTELKGGTAFIQKMSKSDIIPIAIQPSIGIKGFLGRRRNKIAFGPPIKYLDNVKYDRQKLAEVDHQLANALEQLDKQLDPNYVYDPKVHQKR